MEFTYEEKMRKNPLETYEWDQIWWDHPELEGKRVLLIGDSISCGYRRMVGDKLEQKIFADGFGTSKALDHPKFLEGLQYLANQQKRCDLIHFNNGLHGWHLCEKTYETAYIQLIKAVRKLFGGVPVIVALTTPLRDAQALTKFAPRNDVVLKRNEIASRIAQDLGFAVNDLYTPLRDRPELFLEDGVHLSQKGYELLADLTADMVRSALQ